jgi:hypothetical protein
MWRRPVFYVPGLILSILMVVELTSLSAEHLLYPGGHSDQFATYDAIMPGQPITALNWYPCYYEKGLERDLEPTLCHIRPGKGIFSEVIVLFHSDSIWQVTFKTEALTVGDLVQRWGFPDVHHDNQGVLFLQWRGGSVYAVVSPDTHKRRFSYLMPVYSVIVTETAVSA